MHRGASRGKLGGLGLRTGSPLAGGPADYVIFVRIEVPGKRVRLNTAPPAGLEYCKNATHADRSLLVTARITFG